MVERMAKGRAMINLLFFILTLVGGQWLVWFRKAMHSRVLYPVSASVGVHLATCIGSGSFFFLLWDLFGVALY